MDPNLTVPKTELPEPNLQFLPIEAELDMIATDPTDRFELIVADFPISRSFDALMIPLTYMLSLNHT